MSGQPVSQVQPVSWGERPPLVARRAGRLTNGVAGSIGPLRALRTAPEPLLRLARRGAGLAHVAQERLEVAAVQGSVIRHSVGPLMRLSAPWMTRRAWLPVRRPSGWPPTVAQPARPSAARTLPAVPEAREAEAPRHLTHDSRMARPSVLAQPRRRPRGGPIALRLRGRRPHGHAHPCDALGPLPLTRRSVLSPARRIAEPSGLQGLTRRP